MKSLLIAAVVLGVASLASAQTTTSTSTSTSTTLVLSWACVRDSSIVENDHYQATGHCAGTGAYQSGGAPLGSAATLAATSQALCGSGSQKLVNFIKTDHPVSGVATAVCSLSDAFVYQCATTIGSEMSTSNVTPSPFHYLAVCK